MQIFLTILLIGAIYVNYKSCERSEKLLKDIEKLDKELATLKLLNKLCVDSEGNLIKGIEYNAFLDKH